MVGMSAVGMEAGKVGMVAVAVLGKESCKGRVVVVDGL